MQRGDANNVSGYENGDTATDTFLRRANIQYGQNSQGGFRISDRLLDTFKAKNSKPMRPYAAYCPTILLM